MYDTGGLDLKVTSESGAFGVSPHAKSVKAKAQASVPLTSLVYYINLSYASGSRRMVHRADSLRTHCSLVES